MTCVRVLGLDGALATTGFVIFDGSGPALRPVYVEVLTTEPGRKRGERAAHESWRRCVEISRAVTRVVEEHDVGLVVLDELAGWRSAFAAHALGLAWGALAVTVAGLGVPWLVVGHRDVRLRICGRLTVTKEDVKVATLNRSPRLEALLDGAGIPGGKREHVYDAAALVLAAMDEPIFKAVVGRR